MRQFQSVLFYFHTISSPVFPIYLNAHMHVYLNNISYFFFIPEYLSSLFLSNKIRNAYKILALTQESGQGLSPAFSFPGMFLVQ